MDKNIVIKKNTHPAGPNNKSAPFSWTDGLACLLPLAAWLTISWMVCCRFNPHGAAWAFAVPISLFIGFFLTFLGAQIIGSGVSTLSELNVSCGILLVLALVISPSFRATQNAAHKRDALHQIAPKQISQKVPGKRAIP